MTDVREEVSIDLSFLTDERTEDPCEDEFHDTRPIVHSGPGVWLIRIDFSCCGRGPAHYLICDRFKQVLVKHGKGICKDCNYLYKEEEWQQAMTIVGRKGVDF